MNNKFDFFVSYSRDVYDEIVEPLIRELEILGFNIWIDRTEVTLGTNIYKNLDDVLAKISDWNGAIVFIDNSYINKEWCQWESNFFVENRIFCYPILYKISKSDLIDSMCYYKDFNIATIKNKSDLKMTVDKILMSYIENLQPQSEKFIIYSKLLTSIIMTYKQKILSMEENIIICNVICQIIKNLSPEYIYGNHHITILTNIIEEKARSVYKNGKCSRYEFILVRKIANYLINNIKIAI